MRKTTDVISTIPQPYVAPSLQRLDTASTESATNAGDDGLDGGSDAS